MTTHHTKHHQASLHDIVAVGLHPALRISPSSYWTEIRTVEQAMLVERLVGEVDFGAQFRGEHERCGAHAMPHRWFALIDENHGHPVARVAMCVPSGHRMDDAAYRRAFHATGHRNANPYPEFAHLIAEFGTLLGIRIPPNWLGRKIDESPTHGTSAHAPAMPHPSRHP